MSRHTLLLRLAGPMQAWGIQSRFQMRDTALEPTKSGVIGLLCAALGWGRDCDLTSFNQLTMGVRVDRPGRMMMDYQTAQQIITADLTGTKTGVSRRYFLADASFLVGLESSDLAWLSQLYETLRNPTWRLFLGRKSYVPSLPVWLRDGLQEGLPLLEAIRSFPWLDRTTREKQKPALLRHVIESDAGFIQQPDWPQTFDSRRRWYLPRRVEITYWPPPEYRYLDVENMIREDV